MREPGSALELTAGARGGGRRRPGAGLVSGAGATT